MAALNPVEQRLSVLCEHWVAFRSQPKARALIWKVPPDAMRVVECFVEMQKHDVPYASGDVMILLKVPYHHALQFCRELKVALRGQFDASAEDLAAQGLATDWSFTAESTLDTAEGFVDALRAFKARYLAQPAGLAVALLPPSVADSEAFARWALRVIATLQDDAFRLLLPEAADAPFLQSLERRSDSRVVVQTLTLNTFAMAQEAFAQEVTVGPAGVYRNLMMGVVTLLESGSVDAILAKAGDALDFARKQGWADQEVALRTMVAGAFLKEGQHADAATAYQAARVSALQTLQANHPVALKLVAQTWFGEAGVMVAAADFKQAARCYDEAASVAERDGNAVLYIEALRMAAWCLARSGDSAGALGRGGRAADVGAALAPEARAETTLPIAMVDMLNVVDEPRVRSMQQIKSQLHAQLEAVRARSEARGEELGGRPDALARVEQERQQSAHRLAEQARLGLETQIAAGPPAFVKVARRAAELLGADWMVVNDIALRPLPVAAAESGGTSP